MTASAPYSRSPGSRSSTISTTSQTAVTRQIAPSTIWRMVMRASLGPRHEEIEVVAEPSDYHRESASFRKEAR